MRCGSGIGPEIWAGVKTAPGEGEIGFTLACWIGLLLLHKRTPTALMFLFICIHLLC